MRFFRPLLLIAVLSASPATPGKQGGVPDDPYNVETVKKLVESNQHKPGAVSVIFGFEMKSNVHMGDAVSIGLLKAYSERELLRPEIVRSYLPVIRAAFASPGYIIHKADLEPRVTLFLLHFLEQNLKDGELKKQVRNLDSDLSKLIAPSMQPKP